jgi:hypothetical protein
VVQQVLDRPDGADQYVQVGRSRGQETDEQPPPERERLVVGLRRRGRPRQQRAGQGMRQSIHAIKERDW